MSDKVYLLRKEIEDSSPDRITYSVFSLLYGELDNLVLKLFCSKFFYKLVVHIRYGMYPDLEAIFDRVIDLIEYIDINYYDEHNNLVRLEMYDNHIDENDIASFKLRNTIIYINHYDGQKLVMSISGLLTNKHDHCVFDIIKYDNLERPIEKIQYNYCTQSCYCTHKTIETREYSKSLHDNLIEQVYDANRKLVLKNFYNDDGAIDTITNMVLGASFKYNYNYNIIGDNCFLYNMLSHVVYEDDNGYIRRARYEYSTFNL